MRGGMSGGSKTQRATATSMRGTQLGRERPPCTTKPFAAGACSLDEAKAAVLRRVVWVLDQLGAVHVARL
jgi:hypothetical protein